MPRLVLHVDRETAAALTAVYRDCLPPGARVLDLMSSWVSHLPDELRLSGVTGLGMNAAELAANPRLDRYAVQDLNAAPTLPFADAAFDAVLNAFSVQYLTRPVEVFAEVARVLAPGGLHLVAISHRCFPTKAVRGWLASDDRTRVAIVGEYFRRSGAFDTPVARDCGAPGDPLYAVWARTPTG